MCFSKLSLSASQLVLALATFQGLAVAQLDQNLEDFWAYGRSPPVYPSREYLTVKIWCLKACADENSKQSVQEQAIGRMLTLGRG